jgi:hypothetical protein
MVVYGCEFGVDFKGFLVLFLAGVDFSKFKTCSYVPTIFKIYSDKATFIALKADGSITAWGYSERDGASVPSDSLS